MGRAKDDPADKHPSARPLDNKQGQVRESQAQADNSGKFFAVVTGDVVGSSKLVSTDRVRLPQAMKEAFCHVQKALATTLHCRFEVYRGDSFQGVLSRPDAALRAALILRTSLRSHTRNRSRRSILDARISIGIDTVSHLPAEAEGASSGLGDAFVRSGRTLDRMKETGDRLLFDSAVEDLNEEMAAECALLDALIRNWSARQSEAVLVMLVRDREPVRSGGRFLRRAMGTYFDRLTQVEAGRKLGITQGGLNQRLKAAGYPAIRKVIGIYQKRASRLFGGSPPT